MQMKTDIVFLDFETTGINVFNSDAIEIGAVYLNKKLEIVNKFSSFIKPRIKSRMKASSFKTHGHNIEELLDKPSDSEVLKNYFNDFGTNYCFGGWNISFDIPFFRKMCHRNGRMSDFNKINYRHVDVQSIVRLATELNILDPRINSLDDCSIFLGLKRSKEHSAIQDAEITCEIFKNLLGLFANISESKESTLQALY